MSERFGSGVPPADAGDELALLSGYLDGELTADERGRVEAHLAESPRWRQELDDVGSARAAVRALPVREPPAHFFVNVSNTVRAADTDPRAPEPDEDDQAAAPVSLADRRAEGRGRRRSVWLAAAAGVAAAVIAVFVIPGRTQVRPDITAVATQHAATSADVGDPISGLVPLGPLRGSR